MKKLNERQNNKGFSLVELIVVIAIMVVLVAVLAPLFSRYIESSRRSTDVQTATSIKEAVLADYTEGSSKIVKDGTVTEVKTADISALNGEDPKVQGDKIATKGDPFYYSCTKDGVVKVGVDNPITLDLTDADDAETYKQQ